MNIKKFGFILLVSSFLFGAKYAAAQQVGPVLSDINLGLVVQNDQYTIYRSGELGNDGLDKLYKYLQTHKLPKPKTIIYMNKNGYSFPFYFAIEEYEASLDGLFTFYHSFGNDLRTYVDGHNPYYPKEDIDKDTNLGSRARRYFHLDHDNGRDGGVDTIMKILEIILDPQNQPVLFHCHGGMHRTGMMAMIIRHLQGGYWVNGPKRKEHDLRLNPAEHEYTLFNSTMFRKENIEFIRRFIEDPRFLQLRNTFGESLRDGSEHSGLSAPSEVEQ